MKKYLLPLGLTALFTSRAFSAAPVVIADFENLLTGTPHGTAITAEVVKDAEHVKEGVVAMKLVIDHATPTTVSMGWKVPAGTIITKETGRVSFWIMGDGTETKLQFSITATDKGMFSVEKTITGAGWQEVVIPLSEFTFNTYANNPPEAAKELNTTDLFSFSITDYKGLNSTTGKTTLYIDSIKLVP